MIIPTGAMKKLNLGVIGYVQVYPGVLSAKAREWAGSSDSVVWLECLKFFISIISFNLEASQNNLLDA